MSENDAKTTTPYIQLLQLTSQTMKTKKANKANKTKTKTTSALNPIVQAHSHCDSDYDGGDKPCDYHEKGQACESGPVSSHLCLHATDL